MMRSLFGRRQVAGVNHLDSSTLIANHQIHRLLWSAITLTFFVALLVGAMLARRNVHHSTAHAGAIVQASVIGDQPNVTVPLVDENDGSTASTPDNTTTTINTRANVNNGKANVDVTVNGQSIPVSQNGSTHTEIDNNQTSVDVNINNNQVNSNGSDNSMVNVTSQTFQYSSGNP